MKQFLNAGIAGAVVVGGLWLAVKPSYATVDYAKAEKKGCTYCHPAAPTKGKAVELTEAGEYYKGHDHSFKGYVPKDPKSK